MPRRPHPPPGAADTARANGTTWDHRRGAATLHHIAGTRLLYWVCIAPARRSQPARTIRPTAGRASSAAARRRLPGTASEHGLRTYSALPAGHPARSRSSCRKPSSGRPRSMMTERPQPPRASTPVRDAAQRGRQGAPELIPSAAGRSTTRLTPLKSLADIRELGRFPAEQAAPRHLAQPRRRGRAHSTLQRGDEWALRRPSAAPMSARRQPDVLRRPRRPRDGLGQRLYGRAVHAQGRQVDHRQRRRRDHRRSGSSRFRRARSGTRSPRTLARHISATNCLSETLAALSVLDLTPRTRRPGSRAAAPAA